MNLTGSPDYGARINYTGTDDGCSDNQYKQFDTSKVSGPTYGSVGLESGRNYLIGCPIYRTDLAIARNIRVGGGRQLQLRVDAFNAFNQAFVTGRGTSIQYNSPTDQTPTNSEHERGWHAGRDPAAAEERGFRRRQRVDDEPDQRQLSALHPVHGPVPVLDDRTRTKTRSGWAFAPTRFFCLNAKATDSSASLSAGFLRQSILLDWHLMTRFT